MDLQPLGIVVQGSLSDGLEVRLNGEISVEDMRVGKFLVVHGRHTRFFCILTDVTLGTASPRILMNPPDPENSFLTEILAGTGTFGTINLTPMLMFVPSNPFDLLTQRASSDRLKKTKRKKSPVYES
ncbi:MAG: HAS-barrel domain-containing protein, partial [Pseudanabaena sp.]